MRDSLHGGEKCFPTTAFIAVSAVSVCMWSIRTTDVPPEAGSNLCLHAAIMGTWLLGLKNNGDNYVMAVVALPGIKMWAGKQREDQVCTKDGWTQWCSPCQRWPTEGKLQHKYTLLKTLSPSPSLTHAHIKMVETMTNLAVCGTVPVCWFGVWLVAKEPVSLSDTQQAGKDMGAVFKTTVLSSRMGPCMCFGLLIITTSTFLFVGSYRNL